MQYTIRGVPDTVDAALRRRARALGRSLNEVALEALADGAGVCETRHARRDLADVAGTWIRERSVEVALAAQDSVDTALWR
jgi:plasmid stability protein